MLYIIRNNYYHMTEKEKKIFLIDLLKTSSNSTFIFDNAIKLIYSHLRCKYISLWSINESSNTMSLISHCHKRLIQTKFDKQKFVHKVENSFTSKVLTKIEDSYYDIENIQNHIYFEKHRSKEFIISENFYRCIIIDIPNNNRTKNYYDRNTILYLYLEPKTKIDEEIINIIKTYLSLAIGNYHVIRKDHLTDQIISLHEKKGKKDISSLFYPIINKILKDFIKYEAASIFVYDPQLNRLNLASTTGLEGKPKKENVYYLLGEGLTGEVAQSKKYKIKHATNLLTEKHIAKFRELKRSKTQSTLFVPIISNVNSSILGVIRFVNRRNPVSNVLDYFSKEDLAHISHVRYLLGLYIEFDKSEDIIAGFSKQLVHETITPAVGIGGVASRLKDNLHDEIFLHKNLKPYTHHISEYSELQIAQSSNIIYAWQRRRNKSKKQIYESASYCKIEELIIGCKKLVFPILRDEDLKYDNINLVGDFPLIYADKHAFDAVFLNIIRNAIKYRDPFDDDKFRIDVIGQRVQNFVFKGESLRSGHIIDFQDNGIGINDDENDLIFLLGVRGKGVEKYAIRGLGIGLYVCRQILNDFYCRIWVEGFKSPTVFRLFIPDKLNTKSYTKTNDWIKIN